MAIEAGILERVANLGPVTALVSTRVYQAKLPQHGPLPAVRLQLVSERRPQHLKGPLGLTVSRIQTDAYAEEVGNWYDSVSAVADAIHGDGLGPNASGLAGFIGILPGSPPAYQIANVMPDTRRTIYEFIGERRLVRMQQDYLVWWWAL